MVQSIKPILRQLFVVREMALCGLSICNMHRLRTIKFQILDLLIGVGTDFGYRLDIRRIILPDNITEFGECAFYGLTLETINIPSSLRKLGKNCFDENRWLSVNPLIIPEGVTEIPTQCFQFCYKLKKVVLPSTIKTIGILAFFDSLVDDMNFPEGLDSIGYLSMHGARLTEVVLPKTIKKIGFEAFGSNSKLKRVVLPEGLTEIPDKFCRSCIELER